MNNIWQKETLKGNGFTAVTSETNIANQTETGLLLLRNLANSTQLLRFWEYIFTIDATAAQKSKFRFYRNPTITSVANPLTVNKILSFGSKTSVILAYEKGQFVISANGTLVNIIEHDFKSFVFNRDLARFLPPGSDLLITVESGNNNIVHTLAIAWLEQTLDNDGISE